MPRVAPLISLAIAALLAACSDGPVEEYVFITTLGNDTIAVEQVRRSRTRLVADGVDRFPFTRIRHTGFEFEPGGRMYRMVMDVRTPNGQTPAERWRRVTADVGERVVRVSVRDSAQTRDTSFTHGGDPVVPHVSMMYSVIEHEIATALRAKAAQPGDSGWFRQFYPDRDVGPSFTLHKGRVFLRAGGRVELRHDWLAGTGEAVFDSAHRMLSYDGRRTTYQVSVVRSATPPEFETIAGRMVAAEKQGGLSQLSVRDTTRASIGGARFLVDYSRPLLRGRVLLGDVIPYDRVWRTGANAATQFETSVPVALGRLELPAGKYTLFTVPRRTGVELIVNSQTDQWGTSYDRTKDFGTVPMAFDSLAAPVERFTIAIDSSAANRGMLAMEWGPFRWTVPVVVRRQEGEEGRATRD